MKIIKKELKELDEIVLNLLPRVASKKTQDLLNSLFYGKDFTIYCNTIDLKLALQNASAIKLLECNADEFDDDKPFHIIYGNMDTIESYTVNDLFAFIGNQLAYYTTKYEKLKMLNLIEEACEMNLTLIEVENNKYIIK